MAKSDSDKPTCGAKVRGAPGAYCRNPPMRGKTRCRMHGGASTGHSKSKTVALKHGIYSGVLTAEEEGLYDSMLSRLGSIDEEIVMARLRLWRAKRAKELFDRGELISPISEEMDEVEIDQDSKPTKRHRRVIKKHPDYEELIHTYLRTIARLELARKNLLGDAVGEYEVIAEKINQALADIDAIMTSPQNEL